MSIADLIRRMAEAGASPEAIALAVDAIEARDQADEQRRAYARDKKRRQRAGQSRDSEGTNGDIPPSSPIPLVPPSQTLPPIIPQTPSSTDTKRARRLPIDWALPMAWGEWAKGEGFPEQVIRLEAEKFRDFWCSKSGKDATKLDWEATWRNWMRNVRSRSSPQSQQPRQTAFQQRHQSAIDAFDRKLGVSPDDQFAGSTIDLGNADWRPH